jgi:alpha-amylase
MSRGDGRHAVTFMESHDWFLRPDNENEFCGRGNSMKPEIKARLMQCNAMLLSLPGVPCIFYPHWAKYKEDLKPMIFARKAAGVHSESATNDEEVSATGYKITVVGKRGNLILMLGDKVQGDNPASWLPENNYYKMVSNYSTMDGHNESLEIWVSMFDGSDPREYDPSKEPVDPTPDPDPEPEPTPIEPDPNYRNSAPENCTDVMIQAFYWDSYEKESTTSKTHVYGHTKWVKFTGSRTKSEEYGPDNKRLLLANEMGRWFDLVWLPPMSRATGGTGYLPIQYSNLKSDWGEESQLRKLIGMLHTNGAKVIADIVINHASGEPTWCEFAEQNFGEYGVYQPTAKWICNTDDLNWSDEAREEAGDCYKKASGNADAGYDGLDDFKGGRDWDHKNVNVQNMCKSYLKWLVNDVYVDGFRYDYVKGFKNGYIADYNAVANPYFTVMEAWSGDVGNLQYHLNEARRKSMTFDFATKFTAFNDGLTNNNYNKLKGSGLLGAGEGRYAVTFIDNHDTFLRKDENGWSNEFMGYEQSMANDANKAKVLQANAFILSMPGVPCVFYPHWVVFKDQLKPMINARYKTGVHSQSNVSDEAGQNFYKATIYGTNGEIRLLLGPGSGYDTTPAGYTLAVKGTNFGVYYKTTSPRNDKNTDRTPITTAVEDVEENEALQVEKFIYNGQLYIRLGDKIYDMMGRNVQ